MKNFLLPFVAILIVFVSCNKEEGTNPKIVSTNNFQTETFNSDSESDKFSYSIGMIIGNTLKNNDVDSIDYSVIDRAFSDDLNDQFAYTIASKQAQTLEVEEIDAENVNKALVKKAIFDVLKGDTTNMTLEEVSNSYQTYLANSISKLSDENLEKGNKFLETKKAEEGVQVTNSGLVHRLIEKGTGKMPTNKDVIETVFSIKTITGADVAKSSTEYVDLSDDEMGIKGLVEGLKLYPLGSKVELFVPANLAFGQNRVDKNVGPNSTIIIEIEDSKSLEGDKLAQYRQAKRDYQKQVEAAMKAQRR